MRRPFSLRTWSFLTVSASVAAFALPITSATASEPRVEVARVAPIPADATVVNAPITTSFDVVLTQPREAALTAFIASLSDTASPNYHHYLTPAQFALDFGASASQVDAVRGYLAHYGLRVDSLSKGHIILHVSGLTTNIAHAFDAAVETVRVGSTLHAQLATKATLPASIAADVSSVVGLSTVDPVASHALARVSSHVATANTCAAATGGSSASSTTPNSLGGYTVQQQAQLYGLATAWASGDTGVGQVIGAYELGQYDQGDLAAYETCYGISPTITNINVDGGATGGYSDEATMDVEEASALAPGATIEIYTGPNSSSGPTDVYQQMADDNTATIITTSWGDCEIDPQGDVNGEQAIFQQMAAQGQTVVAAAGDEGSSDCNGVTTNSPAVDDPASQPYVTGVGGLTVSNISPLTETVWNGKGAGGGASGGGQSQVWSRPLWQVATGITASETMRMVPDLSVMGDPSSGFITYFTGSGTGICHRSCTGWTSVGGTSIGAPLISALVAVAAQTCAVPRLGFINPSLYAMATTGYTDVTTGSNDLFNTGDYSAGVGYDMASGLGSPNGSAFISGLCPAKFSATKSAFTASATTTAVPAVLTVQLRDVNGNPIVNAAVTVKVTAPSGVVVIDGDASSTATTGSSASYEVTTSATGAANVTITTTKSGPLALNVTYQGSTVYSTTLNVTNTPHTALKTPSAPTIARLTALVGGFTLVVRAPSSNGGSAITSYQYSINNGASWLSFPGRSTSVRTTTLVRGHTYQVLVRARNVNGAGPASKSSTIVTLS